MNISLDDIVLFVLTVLLPALNGLVSSLVVQKWKLNIIPDDIPDWIRVGFIRGLVAAVCVVLYVPEQFIQTGHLIDVSTIPKLFYSYVTAAAAFDHLFKKKQELTPVEQ